ARVMQEGHPNHAPIRREFDCRSGDASPDCLYLAPDSWRSHVSEARRIVTAPAARPLGIRPAIEALPASKIGEVAMVGFGDPAVVPLWFGEGDLPTPSFIADAAVAALRDGQTFYTHKRGIPALRQAIAEYLTRLH